MDDEETGSSEEEKRQQLFEYAALGREVDDFWHSSIGRYLILRTEREYVQALSDLSECDPFDETKIIQLQSDARRAKLFKEWLSEAIKTGLMAEAQLEDRENG